MVAWEGVVHSRQVGNLGSPQLEGFVHMDSEADVLENIDKWKQQQQTVNLWQHNNLNGLQYLHKWCGEYLKNICI